MPTRYFCYAKKFNGKPGRRVWLEYSEEGLAEAERDGAEFVSTMTFSHEPKAGSPDPIRYGDLPLDFDHKDDPARAVADALYFIKGLICLGVDSRTLRIYLSGKKGVHVIVPAICYGDVEGDALLPRIHREFISIILQVIGGKIGTLDRTIYDMGQGRLLRRENVRRSNDRYKVPVTYEEMKTLPYSELEMLTFDKRVLDGTECVMPALAPKLAELFQEACKKILLRDSLANSSQAFAELDQCLFIKHCRDNAETLSEKEWFVMISILAPLGKVGKDAIHALSKSYPNYDYVETELKIKRAIMSNKPHTCERIKEVYDCGRNCGVKSPTVLWRKKKAEVVNAEHFVSDETGLYFITDPDDPEIGRERICSPLVVEALVRNPQNASWGRLISIIDPEGVRHEIQLSMSEIGGNGDQWRGILFDHGLQLIPTKRARAKLQEYILTAQPGKFARMVDKLGWHGEAYVLPDGVIGGKEDEMIILETAVSDNLFNTAGTLKEWQDEIGRYCVGNSRLILSVSFALTGCLLHLLGMEGGGLHLFGQSSCGKSTALKVAGSVCGGGNGRPFIRQWRATDNALEGTAALHNDNLLCLDEISQATPKVVSEVAYMLANGQGKGRANRKGDAKARKEWRLMFLSSGEKTLSDKIAEDSQRDSLAGQMVRVVDIEADAGRGRGLYEELHGFPGGRELSDHLARWSVTYYGTPFRAFVERIVEDIDGARTNVSNGIERFREQYCPSDASGQVERVCARFGLAAVAGELAIEFGILPWPQKMAWQAMAALFNSWISWRGGIGNIEEEKALSRVREFIEMHGETRFAGPNADYLPLGMVGYRFIEDDGIRYFIKRPAFRKEFCKGIAKDALLKLLDEKGCLDYDRNGHIKEYKYIQGHGGNVRGYILKSESLINL